VTNSHLAVNSLANAIVCYWITLINRGTYFSCATNEWWKQRLECRERNVYKGNTVPFKKKEKKGRTLKRAQSITIIFSICPTFFFFRLHSPLLRVPRSDRCYVGTAGLKKFRRMRREKCERRKHSRTTARRKAETRFLEFLRHRHGREISDNSETTLPPCTAARSCRNRANSPILHYTLPLFSLYDPPGTFDHRRDVSKCFALLLENSST